VTETPTGAPVASQRVADELGARILSGALAPGARIVQDDLAEELNASRIPVREALRLLQARGLVTIKANAGAWVSRMTMRDCELSYRIRERVEPLLLTESLPLLGPDDLAELAEIQEQIERTDGVEEFLVLDRRLHWAMYRREAAPHLADIIARLWDTTQHYRRAFLGLAPHGRTWTIGAEHRLLIKAVQDGDAEAAETVLALHIRRTRAELVRHPELFSPPAQ
jgi:DNA-binding GntR family transcriptional regulator